MLSFSLASGLFGTLRCKLGSQWQPACHLTGLIGSGPPAVQAWGPLAAAVADVDRRRLWAHSLGRLRRSGRVCSVPRVRGLRLRANHDARDARWPKLRLHTRLSAFRFKFQFTTRLKVAVNQPEVVTRHCPTQSRRGKHYDVYIK